MRSSGCRAVWPRCWWERHHSGWPASRRRSAAVNRLAAARFSGWSSASPGLSCWSGPRSEWARRTAGGFCSAWACCSSLRSAGRWVPRTRDDSRATITCSVPPPCRCSPAACSSASSACCGASGRTWGSMREPRRPSCISPRSARSAGSWRIPTRYATCRCRSSRSTPTSIRSLPWRWECCFSVSRSRCGLPWPRRWSSPASRWSARKAWKGSLPLRARSTRGSPSER